MTYDEYMKTIQKDLSYWLERGINVWQTPWTSARNADTNRKYRGINAWYLTAIAARFYDGDPRFYSFSQAKKQGYRVKKGQHGHPAYFFKTETILRDKRDDKGNLILDEKGNPEKEEVISRPIFKSYIVFNAKQLDGVPDYSPETEIFEQEKADEYIANSPVEIVHDRIGEAYYSGNDDKIHIPQKNLFKTTAGYYSTIFHEMVHSTGSEDRLCRKSLIDYKNERAREELIAELGAVMLCDSVNLKYQNQNSAAYIKSWASFLKEDNFNFASFYKDVSQAIHYLEYPNNRKMMHENAVKPMQKYNPAEIDTSSISSEDNSEKQEQIPYAEILSSEIPNLAEGTEVAINAHSDSDRSNLGSIFVEFHNSDFDEIKENVVLEFSKANELLRKIKDDISGRSGWDSVEYDIHYTNESNEEQVYSGRFTIASKSTDLMSDLLNNAINLQDDPDKLSEHVKLIKCIQKLTAEDTQNKQEFEDSELIEEKTGAEYPTQKEYPYVKITHSTVKELSVGNTRSFSEFNDLMYRLQSQKCDDSLDSVAFDLVYMSGDEVKECNFTCSLDNGSQPIFDGGFVIEQIHTQLLNSDLEGTFSDLVNILQEDVKLADIGNIMFQVPELQENYPGNTRNWATLKFSVETVPLKDVDFFIDNFKGKLIYPDKNLVFSSANPSDDGFPCPESSLIDFEAELLFKEDGKISTYYIYGNYDFLNDDSIFDSLKRSAWEKIRSTENPFNKSKTKEADKESYEKILYYVVPSIERQYLNSITPQRAYISSNNKNILSLRHDKISGDVSYKIYDLENGLIKRIQDVGFIKSQDDFELDFKELCNQFPEISDKKYSAIGNFEFKSLENTYNEQESLKAEKIRKLSEQGKRANELLNLERNFEKREYLRYICDFTNKSSQDVWEGKEPAKVLSEQEFKKQKLEELRKNNPAQYQQRLRWNTLQQLGEIAKAKLENATGNDRKYFQYVIDFQRKSQDIPESEWLKKPVSLPLDQDVYIKKLCNEKKFSFPWGRR